MDNLRDKIASTISFGFMQHQNTHNIADAIMELVAPLETRREAIDWINAQATIAKLEDLRNHFSQCWSDEVTEVTKLNATIDKLTEALERFAEGRGDREEALAVLEAKP
jgi:hypothetical protein